jgi:transcriptional regulator with XRE-family HTH domain
MKALVDMRAQARTLRKKGLTYQEILRQLPVAKSSLSLWLKDFPLTKAEKHLLKKRKDSNISLGRIRAATSNRQNKIDKDQLLLSVAKTEFEMYKNNTLFHTGIALYWAEGAKRNEMFHFVNSDSEMINVLIRWLETFTEYKRSDLGFRLYIHQPFIRDNWEFWWQKQLGISSAQFKKTVIKPSGLGVKKRPNYKGCIRLEVPKSVYLLTKMKFWMNMQVEYHSKQ